MVLVKVVPIVPGHFTSYEWLALAIWAVLGLIIRIPAQRQKKLLEQVAQPAPVSGESVGAE
jgi:heme exporter protein D